MQNAPLGAFCNTFDLHYAIIRLGSIFESGRFTQVILYHVVCINTLDIGTPKLIASRYLLKNVCISLMTRLIIK